MEWLALDSSGLRDAGKRPEAQSSAPGLLISLLMCLLVGACADANVAGPRAFVVAAGEGVGLSIDPASCRYVRPDWRRGYYGKPDGIGGDTNTVCGIVVGVSAPPTFGDSGAAWYYGIDPDSIYLGSGSWAGPYQGQNQTYITTNKPIKDVQVLWGFSPMAGSTITLYDALDSVLAVHTNGSASQPTRFPSNYPNFGDFHWEELATFSVRGVRRIKLSTNGSPTGGASILAQLFFKPDSQPRRILVDCTPASVTRASSTPVTCTASAAGGVLAITSWTFTATDPAIGSIARTSTSVSWSGMAVASGDVTVQGTVDGVSTPSDTGRFAVTARPGWTWSADKSTGDAAPGKFECNPARHYATGRFGWMHADSTCRNEGLMLWPDPIGTSSRRGYSVASVAAGPNAGLWYASSDGTGMHVRAQVLKDIRPDGSKYSVSSKDTVGARCKAAGVKGNQTVTVVNNTCMTDPSPVNFAALYDFAWRHERCHLALALNAFPNVADPRTFLEGIVRSDTTAFHSEAVYGTHGFAVANEAIGAATRIIDAPGSQSYWFWSRNATNSAWSLRIYSPNAMLAPGC